MSDRGRLVEEAETLRQELLMRRSRRDAAFFAQLLDFQPASYQLAMIQATLQFVLVNCCRQAGKTTAGALLALHRALMAPNQVVLLFGAAGRQANEILEKVKSLLGRMPVRPDVKDNSRTMIRFRNGSRIICYPSRVPEGGTIRGPSPNLIIHDEAAFAPEALFRATLPMVMRSRGQIYYLSTPDGKHSEERPNFFHKMWMFATSDHPEAKKWGTIEAPYTSIPQEVPGFKPVDIELARVALGPMFAQEYECQFLSPGAGVLYPAFSRDRNVIAKLPVLPPDEAWTFLLGVDPGVGNATGFVVGAYTKNDPCLYIVHSVQEKALAPTDVANRIQELRKTFPFVVITLDTGGMGAAYAQQFTKYHGIFVKKADKLGKAAHIQMTNGLMASGWIKVLSSNGDLLSQIENLTWNRTRTGERDGSPSDLADAFLYMVMESTAYLQRPREGKLTEAERIEREVEKEIAELKRQLKDDDENEGMFAGIGDPFADG